MDRRSSCCSGRSYAPPTVTTPKKEPTVSPMKESDVKPVTVALKTEAKEISSLDSKPMKESDVKPVTVDLKTEAKEISSLDSKVDQGLPKPAPVETEEKVNVNVSCGAGSCGF